MTSLPPVRPLNDNVVQNGKFSQMFLRWLEDVRNNVDTSTAALSAGSNLPMATYSDAISAPVFATYQTAPDAVSFADYGTQAVQVQYAEYT